MIAPTNPKSFLTALSVLLALGGCAADVASSSASLYAPPPDDPPPSGDGSLCDDYSSVLYAGRHIVAGSVRITNDPDNVYVEITTDDGWLVDAYHVYVGPGPVPQNRAGAPRPGHFPYSQAFQGGTASVTVTIPLDDFVASCGDDLTVAVHTELHRGRQSETGWADGPSRFGRGWGTFDTYGVCCASTCVYPSYIWRDHQDWWGLSSLEMGGRVYDQDELMTLLWTPTWGDASIEVLWQYIAAALNLANGATMNDAEYGAFLDASVWLGTYADADGELPYVIHSVNEGFFEGRSLAEALRAWNEAAGSQPFCTWWIGH